MTTIGDATDRIDLESVEIHDVLSNRRRQMVLRFLQESNGRSTARDLAERIAEIETGKSPPPRNIRQSAYVALHQTHLPKLDELGIIDYDQEGKTVGLTDRANQVRVYMETVPKYGISWAEYYIIVASLGLLLIVASERGVPVLVDIGSLALVTGVLLLIAFSSIYQTISQRSSIIHRLLE